MNKNATQTLVASILAGAIPGKIIYVDGTDGLDGNNGLSWATALKTIAAANTLAVAGDSIYIKGSFSETVTVSKAGIRIVGIGVGPKQATWTSLTDTATLTIAASYVRVENVYFKPPTYTASTTYGPAAILLSSANWAYIVGCRFQGQTGSYNAIYSPVCNSDNVHIIGCEFLYMNTATSGCAILGVEADGLSYSGWVIENCIFSSCVTAININGRCCTIRGCALPTGGIVAATGLVGTIMTLGIDLSGTSSGGNMVFNNSLGGAYTSTLYKAGAAGDLWRGNYVAITSTTGAYGVSVEQPA